MPKRTDSNHTQIVGVFRKMGCSVRSLAGVGKGVPDLIVGLYSSFLGAKINLLVEVKDGSKVRSKKKLTEAEAEFFESWRGQVCIVESVEDAINLISKYR